MACPRHRGGSPGSARAPPGDSSGLSPSIAHHEGSSRAPPCAPGPGPPVRPQPSPGSSALPSEAPACRPGGRRPSASLCSRLAKGRVPPSRRHRCVCHNPQLGLRTEQLPASSQALSVGWQFPRLACTSADTSKRTGFQRGLVFLAERRVLSPPLCEGVLPRVRPHTGPSGPGARAASAPPGQAAGPRSSPL